MSTFIASNGVKIEVLEEGGISCSTGRESDELLPALREYFQAKRDQELGRWRDPESPDFVCYPDEGFGPDNVIVLDEKLGLAWQYSRSSKVSETSVMRPIQQSARRYFEAHPKPELKPWEDAQKGEVWLLSSEGEEHAWTVQESGYGYLVFCRYLPSTKTVYTQLINDSNITAGRRIWPEEGGDQ